MALSMSLPWKHPKIGIDWLRRGAWDASRPVVGKRDIKLSLKTKDPEKSKQEHLKALTEPEAPKLAQAVHDAVLAACRDSPSQRTSWNAGVGGILWKVPALDFTKRLDMGLTDDPTCHEGCPHRHLCGEEARAFAQAEACSRMGRARSDWQKPAVQPPWRPA
ncbi:hypothetical protein [Microvirga sp. BSC39]|uniref:hypothetical protein n=1 Tax=Microvirga sp. BSC39 TaxID=1549810 RepID=UPI0004E866BE|nr:hypothetical protein [Microvirga sp. BSC39]KFG68089.1 hypothetical protein JH26_19480 [Microvirga sp. BSC39]